MNLVIESRELKELILEDNECVINLQSGETLRFDTVEKMDYRQKYKQNEVRRIEIKDDIYVLLDNGNGIMFIELLR